MIAPLAIHAPALDTIKKVVTIGDSVIITFSRDTIYKTKTETVYVTKPPVPAPTPSGAAELPRVLLDANVPAPAGLVRSVSTSAALQSALNAAQYGDVIELQNGVTFVGNFTLPYKPQILGSNQWITLRPATSQLTAGIRMSPAQASVQKLPIIQGISSLGSIQTAAGAHHFRLIGIEITIPSAVSNNGLLRIGTGSETNILDLPHNLVLDHLYIHGTPSGTVIRCVSLNSASTAIIDSYISDCHAKGPDAQAIAGWGGPGPYLIQNNYLEASGENLSFGGADPVIPNLVPSDIYIIHNHFFKPLAWQGVWTVKNLFELKTGQRVLVEGNVFENNWQDAQGGSAVNLKSTNQDGKCPWCGTRDVTFRWNWIKNTGSGFNLSGAPDPNVTNFHLQRVSIIQNLVTGIDTGVFRGDGRGFLINGDVTDLFVANNTVASPTNAAIILGGPLNQLPVRFTFQNNLIGGGAYGVKGPGLSISSTFSTMLPSAVFLGNVVSTASSLGFPSGNQYPTSLQLKPDFSSSWPGVGVDISALLRTLSGVVVP